MKILRNFLYAVAAMGCLALLVMFLGPPTLLSVYGAPCFIPLVLVFCFAAVYCGNVGEFEYRGMNFRAYLRSRRVVYCILVAALAVAYWFKADVRTAAFVLFFGGIYFAGILLVTLVVAALSYKWPGLRTGIAWFWGGVGVFYVASIAQMAVYSLFGGSWHMG
jgi:hypothetical protein